ncbi:MAG: SDR family oxidoreductase [Chloroflexi bacterium]|nr:SDR family oxidoreductase [Chloroflexota bacterium]
MGGIAEGLAEEGADLVCIDIRAEYAEQCAQSVINGGRRAIGIACDVTDEEQVIATVERAKESFGGLDILVNGATVFNTKGVLDMPLDEWRQQTDVMLTGAFLFTKHAAKQMIDLGRRGNMINIISTAGHQGEPGNIGYGTAKGGLLNFTRSVAMELAQYGIRVNSVTPTATDRTEGSERAKRWGVDWPPPRRGQRNKGLLPDASTGSPLRKLPSPSHYAKAAAFLASDEAEMITGLDLRVDAGAISKYWIWDPSAEASNG